MLGKAGERAAATSAIGPDEARLIKLVAEGDLHAFELLYRSYFPRLTRFLDRMINRPNLIGEILDDTMLVVWQKASSFDGSCKLSTWIFAIAYRKALKAVRGLDDPIDCDFETCADETGHGPEDEARHHELQEQLIGALDLLGFDQRAVVCLTYFHGLGYSEIADIMNCPVNTVKTRMFHARRQLKTLLARRMEEM
jgi:RNA polymerase sigma-70 factor (ECF subfamily)